MSANDYPTCPKCGRRMERRSSHHMGRSKWWWECECGITCGHAYTLAGFERVTALMARGSE